MGGRWRVVIPVLAVAVACSNGDTPDVATSTTAAPPAIVTASTTTVPVDAYRRFGTARTVATAGSVVGTSLDGTAIYVLRPDPSRLVPDCAGTRPADALYRVSLTGAADEPVLAGTDPVAGQVVRGPGGRVAVFKVAATDGCPGWEAKVHVGSETADGHLRDLRPITSTGIESLAALAWAADGSRLLTHGSGGRRPTDPWPVVTLDPTSGAQSPVFTVAGPISDVRQLSDGLYAVAHGSRVTLHDRAGAELAGADGVLGRTLADGASVLVVSASAGEPVRVLRAGQASATPFLDIAAGFRLGSLALSPDGRALAYTLAGPGTTTSAVTLRTLPDQVSTPVPVSGTVAAFAGDGKALIVATPGRPSLTVLPLGG